MRQLLMVVAAAALAGPTLAHADKSFGSGRGTTWDCKRDPKVLIDHAGGNYTFKGACKSITLNGSMTKLTIESSETVDLNGSNNQVTIGAVDALNVVGANNTVSYKSAVHGDATKVNNVGANNTVSKAGGGGGGGAAAPAPADAPAAPAGAHDCAKNPTAMINEGGGNHQFVGKCTKILVNGGENTLTIDTVQALVVNGSDNTVTVGNVDKINVSGADNKVSYRKGISGAKPKVGSLGENNQITQIK